MKTQDQLKYDTGKIRYSLIPVKGLADVGKVLTFGAEKYEAESWREIEDKSRYMDALIRHVEQFRAGEIMDEESGLNHMAHVAVNALFLLEFSEGRA